MEAIASNPMIIGAGIITVIIIIVIIFTMSGGSKGRVYIKNSNNDIGGHDIACFQDGSPPDLCKAKCDVDKSCMGYNHVHPNGVWGARSGCCYKTKNKPLVNTQGIDFYTPK